MENDIRPEDTVLIRLDLRGRDGGDTVKLKETVQVSDLGLGEAGGNDADPGFQFDQAEYARLMAEGSQGDPEAIETALQMLADLQDSTADFLARGDTPPAESLAQAVVDWVVETQPQGHTYTTDPNGDGYVISTQEINIHGPIDAGDGERIFRVTAVGTWG